MEFTLEQILRYGLAIATLGGSWAIVKFRLDRNDEQRKEDLQRQEKDMKEFDGLLEGFRKRFHDHIQDSNDKRLEIETKFGRVYADQAVQAQQLKDIRSLCESMDKKMDRLVEERKM